MDLLAQNNDQMKIQFTTRLNRRFNVRELKAVAVKYTGVPAYGTKAMFIESIWTYCFENIQLIIDHSEWLGNPNSDMEEPLLWIIDRTPSPVQPSVRLYEQVIQYESAEDEFIPFLPTNLHAQFEAEAKKFDIVPLMICMETLEELEVETECAICYESHKLEDSITLNCQHKFCHGCISQTLSKCSKRVPTCALCREPMKTMVIKRETIYESMSAFCN
jgi:hypothetical protein